MDHKKAGLWIKHCWTEPFIEAGDFVTLSMGFVKIQVDFENDSGSAFLPHKGEKENFKIAIFIPGGDVFDEITPFLRYNFFRKFSLKAHLSIDPGSDCRAKSERRVLF